MEKTITEEQIQAECVFWFWNEYPAERMYWHHNNNNSLNRIAGARKKALGVVAGVWDIEWMTPLEIMIWIELKIPGNTLSDEQIEFYDKMKARGCRLYVIYSVEEFKNLICRIIGKS